MTSFLRSPRKNQESAISVPRATPPKVFEIATLVALGTEVEGDFTLRNGMRVDGIVRGLVEKAGGPDVDEVTIHVSGTGEIHGDIVADNVIVEGRVYGKVRAMQNLIVKGFISGSATYGDTVELTGEIDASITRLGHVEARDLPPAAPRAVPAARPLHPTSTGPAAHAPGQTPVARQAPPSQQPFTDLDVRGAEAAPGGTRGDVRPMSRPGAIGPAAG